MNDFLDPSYIEDLDRNLHGHRDSPLNPAHVAEVFAACMDGVIVDADGGLGDDCLSVQGIVHTAVFNRRQLAKHAVEIGAMLAQLPNEFMGHDAGGGGGWSFLNACQDRDGNQWTGLHLTMEQLVLLGIGTGQVAWCLPREMWKMLPGEMPYFVVGKVLKP